MFEYTNVLIQKTGPLPEWLIEEILTEIFNIPCDEAQSISKKIIKNEMILIPEMTIEEAETKTTLAQFSSRTWGDGNLEFFLQKKEQQ